MKLRSHVFAVALCLVFATHFARGQTVPSAQGTIPSTGGGATCVTVGTDGQGVVAISVTGTWSGTLQGQVSIGGDAAQNVQVTPYSSSTAQSTITANGAFTATVLGSQQFQLCGNTVASGTAIVKLNVVKLAANRNAGTGTGSGTVSANNGIANAIATYATASGSTTVTALPDFTELAGIATLGAVGAANNGAVTYLGLTSGSITMGCTNATCTQWGGNNVLNVGKVTTNGNCGANGTAANPSVVTCAGASSGTISCSVTASAGTCTVNTTQTTANSVITLTGGNLGTGGTGRLAVTCNTPPPAGAYVSAIAVGVSFTITLPTFTTNPMCFTYVVND